MDTKKKNPNRLTELTSKEQGPRPHSHLWHFCQRVAFYPASVSQGYLSVAHTGTDRHTRHTKEMSKNANMRAHTPESPLKC